MSGNNNNNENTIPNENLQEKENPSSATDETETTELTQQKTWGQYACECLFVTVVSIGIMPAAWAADGALFAYIGANVFNALGAYSGNSGFSVHDAVVNGALGGAAIGILFTALAALATFRNDNFLSTLGKFNLGPSTNKASILLYTMFITSACGGIGYLIKDNLFGGSGISFTQSLASEAIGYASLGGSIVTSILTVGFAILIGFLILRLLCLSEDHSAAEENNRRNSISDNSNSTFAKTAKTTVKQLQQQVEKVQNPGDGTDHPTSS